jgi:hypothetical protein
MRLSFFSTALMTVTLLAGAMCQGAVQYWDPSSSAGYQQGDGAWSATETNWSTNGTILSAWVNTNDAVFPAKGGASAITLTSSLTSSAVNVTGSVYTVIVTNGGRLVSTAVAIGGGKAANDNRVQVVGGAGAPAVWAATAISVGGGNTTSLNGASNNVWVIDGRGVSGSAVTTNSGTLDVGQQTFCPSNELRVIGGGRLFTAGATTVGSTTVGNALRVSGTGSMWVAASADTTVGSGASAQFNSLVVEAGGLATNSGNLWVGRLATGANNNEVRVSSGGGLTVAQANIGSSGSALGNVIRVQGAGSRLGASVTVVGYGANAISNMLLVDDGGTFTNSGAFTVGYTATATSNEVRLTGGGRLLTGGNTTIGASATGNTVRILGGGSQWNAAALTLVGSTAGAAYNSLLVDGLGVSGSATATLATLAIGYNGSPASPASYNAVIVTNGGVLVLGAGYNWGSAVGHGIGVVDGNVYASKSNALVITQGGKVYAGGALMVGYNDYNANLQGNRLDILGADSLLDMRGNGLYAPLSFAANQVCIAGVEIAVDGGMATNVGGLVMPYVTGGQAAHNNVLMLTNGGRFYATAASSVGGTYPGTNNIARVTGSNSLWDLGYSTLAVGNAAGTNNGVIIDQGGRLDSISTLTVYSNNALSLLGGTLGVANWTLNNGAAFAVGDGTQAAALKGLGGSLIFNAGLQVPSNGVLAGIGLVSGGPAGVVLAAGGALSPGLDGAGALSVGGTGLVWQAGAVYRCDVTNLDLGPGAGWDLVAVTGQVAFAAGAVIRLDSRGSVPGRFDAGRNYNVRILSYGSQSGFDAASVVLDTNAFLASGTWSLTNAANSLYLVYRGGGSSPLPTYAWNVPNRGNWSVNGNWQGGSAPAPGGADGLVVSFGDNGTPYVSTNDLAGGFLLNQLQLASESAVTNQIKGNALIFTNAGATVTYGMGSVGSFVVSNAVTASGDLEIGGAALAGTLTFGGAVTNMGNLVKKGSFTLALAGANDIRGNVIVDSPDGTLRLDSLSGAATPGLGNAPALIVSNGTLFVNHLGQNCSLLTANNKSVLATGPGTLWTNVIGNSQYMYLADGVTNGTVTLDNGARMRTPSHLYAASGPAKFNSFVISGGAQAVSSGGGGVGGTASNSVTVSGTGSTWNVSGATVTVGGTGNVMTITDGGLFTNGSLTIGGTGSGLVVTNGGRILSLGTLWIRGVRNTARVVGPGSLVHCTGSGASYIGFGVSENGNIIAVDNAALLTNINLQIGGQGAVNNGLTVAGGSRLITAGLSVGVNPGSTGNVMVLSGSNTLAVTQVTATWVGNAGAAFNRLTVEDNAVLTNIYLIVGFDGCSANTLVATNGGKVFSNVGYDQYVSSGSFATGNAVVVTGTGSVWNAAGKIVYLSSGNTSSLNRLTLEAGGMLTNAGTVVSALGVNSTNNLLTVNGGILQAGTLAWKNLLPNDVTLTGAGQMNLTGFTLSNVNQRLLFNGGLLTVKSAVVSNTLEFTVGDGTQAATLYLVAGGTNIFSAGLAVTNGATLGGSGLVIATSVVHGAFSPGLTGVGALTNNGPLTLNAGSVSRFDVTAATVPGAGWDWLTVTNGALALAGKLTPVLKDGFLPVKADRFLIMTNQGPGVVTGGFGGRVTIYAEDLKTRAGTFRVDAGPQGVVLTDYQAWRPDGALMILY